ncbi:transmembrane domain protein [Mycobacterium xenopi 4042]|uniref:Transmembrane domain protein n=1 Tax=Mycobacterium xenopi 4042 TaxID=1299334 RepID=X7Z9P8_MYCXE|nr:transmembrane domain protein [Mycobacterium xenopi 4042]EUA43086.1 transmembrane domain protein [Mycobacterium xenopi 3993]
MLDPLPRWLRADVLVTGDLTVSGLPFRVKAPTPARCRGCCWPG